MEIFEKSWKLANEKLEIINLGNEQEKKELKIDTLIATEEINRLVSLIFKCANFFARTYAKIHNLDINVVVHMILLVERSKLVKQKTI